MTGPARSSAADEHTLGTRTGSLGFAGLVLVLPGGDDTELGGQRIPPGYVHRENLQQFVLKLIRRHDNSQPRLSERGGGNIADDELIKTFE